MKNLWQCRSFGYCSLALVLALVGIAASRSQASPIRILVVTGGHDFEHDPFFKLFQDNSDISYRAVEHPNAHALLKADAAGQYDVLILYDMYQPISDEAKADLVARLKEGQGLVVLHHAIASYQQWPEYAKIIGARYYLERTVVDGVEKPRSAYKHDMHFRVHIADRHHPITQGVEDFDIHDETYKWFDVAPECHALLTTDEPESNQVIAWTKTYGAARVVYFQSGHDHYAYENANFQRLLKQAIRWAAPQK
jgi:type 1 glutamine amidotransferase